MKDAAESLPSDLAAAHAMILEERAARLEAEAVAARALAVNSNTEALIAHLKLAIEKLRREPSTGRARSTRRDCWIRWSFNSKIWRRQRPRTNWRPRMQRPRHRQSNRSSASGLSRKPFPDHLPRERVVIAAPESCPCCGSDRLSKLGEDITETLEVIPRSWKVIQTVREKFSCRRCETIAQPPAPFHVTPRGFAGPNLLAMILFEKFGQHQPLNRQSERYRREGIDPQRIDAGRPGGCLHGGAAAAACADRGPRSGGLNVCMATTPRCRSWRRAKTIKGHIWTYVRDDRPF